MATILLQQPQHHFSQLGDHYGTGAFASYTGQDNINLNFETELPHTSHRQQQPNHNSPSRWTASQTLPKRASKSPNVQNRTPIRHNRPDMSRHRSGSRPELLMAYAQEQARQAQSSVARNMYMPPGESTGPTYTSHPYVFHPSATPYTQQHPSYFDTTNPHQAYAQLPPQQSPEIVANMYSSPRNDVQLTQAAAAASLNPADTMYGQSRGHQLPPMPSIPSNFPPIPLPLESTPNEVDVVGSRQKPQCWDHGCNGRQFSTFSNLLRHQREKSGTATKARCPHCGTEFTRTTARNGHLYGGKCKGLTESGTDESKAEVQEKDEIP